jgi:hypothetical protein
MPDQVEFVTLYSSEVVYCEAEDGTNSFDPESAAGYCAWRWDLPEIPVRNRSGVMQVHVHTASLDNGLTTPEGPFFLILKDHPLNARSSKNNYPIAGFFQVDYSGASVQSFASNDICFVFPTTQRSLTFGIKYVFCEEYQNIATNGGIQIVLKIVYPEQDGDKLATSLTQTFERTLRV